MQILLSNSQAGPGRKVKQEQEEISRNHVQAFIPDSVQPDIPARARSLSYVLQEGRMSLMGEVKLLVCQAKEILFPGHSFCRSGHFPSEDKASSCLGRGEGKLRWSRHLNFHAWKTLYRRYRGVNF